MTPTSKLQLELCKYKKFACGMPLYQNHYSWATSNMAHVSGVCQLGKVVPVRRSSVLVEKTRARLQNWLWEKNNEQKMNSQSLQHIPFLACFSRASLSLLRSCFTSLSIAKTCVDFCIFWQDSQRHKQRTYLQNDKSQMDAPSKSAQFAWKQSKGSVLPSTANISVVHTHIIPTECLCANKGYSGPSSADSKH